jgi:hypothetical protein
MSIDISKMTMPEVLKHISELSADKRVNAVKQISNLRKEFKVMFWYVYRSDVKFDLPEGTPPYKPMETPENMGHNRLPKELRKFEYLVSSTPMNSIKREKIFIEILESVSPEEAKLSIQIKDKKLSYKGINRKLIEDALPEVFVGEK